MSEKDPLVVKRQLSKSHEEPRLTEEVLISSGFYTPYGSGSGKHHVFEQSPGRCHRPRVIEPVVLLFYLAYNCSVPIQEQFVTKLVRDFYRDSYFDRLVEASDTVGSDVSPEDVSGATCAVPVANETSVGEALMENLIQSQASLWLLYIKLASSVPAMLSTLIICSYGDIGGRKLGILLPSAGCALKTILFIMSMYIESPLYLLFIGSFIEGIFGSHLTFMGSSYAYLADCTPSSKRPLRFTILQCANVIVGLAHIPFGYWIDISGFQQPFWFVAGVLIFAFFYTLVMIPESHPPKEDFVDAQEHEDDTVTGMFQRAGRAFFIYSPQSSGTRRKHAALVLLLCSFNCRVVFEMGKSAVETLYMLAAPLCLSSTVIGYFNALNSFMHGVFGLIGTALFLRCFSENTVCILFTLSVVAGRLVFAYSTTVWLLFLVPFVSIGHSVTLSLTRAMMSSLVSPQQQGALFATIFTLESVCEVFSGALFNSIYAATVSSFKGAVFIVQAAIVFLGALFLVIQACVVKCGRGPDVDAENEKIVRIVQEVNVG